MAAILSGLSVLIDIRGSFYWHELTLIPACLGNHMPSKVLTEITYPSPNFNGQTFEVILEWISNFITHFWWMQLLVHAGI